MRKRLRGVAGVPGLCIGHAVVMRGPNFEHVGRSITTAEVMLEIARFQEASAVAFEQLQTLKKEMAQKVGDGQAGIFEAQAFMIADAHLASLVSRIISDELVSAEKATIKACEAQAKALESLPDPHLAARAADIRDIGKRVVSCLSDGSEPGSGTTLVDGAVLVAEDLTPSGTAALDARAVSGIVLDKGGQTSHTAILARSLGIPAVMGVGNATEGVKDGDILAVDGDEGEVWVGPDPAEVEEFKKRIGTLLDRKRHLSVLKNLPAVTTDGSPILLTANIGGDKELGLVESAGAQGVGLLRTEFLFIGKEGHPSEDEQFETYKHILKRLAPKPVVIRTLDAGGDKHIGYLRLPPEDNPFLGLRAIRLCLRERAIFRTQLRALFRASVYGSLRIMFPMISDVTELRTAKQEALTVLAELEAQGIAVAPGIPLGIMVEVPSAAIQADVLANECDFFSIGTNDLVQYTMAADRGNSLVDYLSDPLYPSVLRLIERTVVEGHKKGIPVAMCGEMAGMSLAVPMLVGVGLDELSMDPAAIPVVKEIVRNLDSHEARSIWDHAVALDTIAEVKSYLGCVLR